MPGDRWELLNPILAAARAEGFLGPGPVEAHLDHARGFAEVVAQYVSEPPRRFCDLGSGGGVPGLVLALEWPEAEGLLIESRQRRAAFLRAQLLRLGVEGRVRVLEDRAEHAGHQPGLRERFEVVTARSFAPPAVTAEIASGLVEVGGWVVVSEPPGEMPGRWPIAALSELGLAPIGTERTGAHFAILTKVRAAPSNRPRAVGIPSKRPLW
jgi:16S rRNA (guanine527-N7)-methyltransferase